MFTARGVFGIRTAVVGGDVTKSVTLGNDGEITLRNRGFDLFICGLVILFFYLGNLVVILDLNRLFLFTFFAFTLAAFKKSKII